MKYSRLFLLLLMPFLGCNNDEPIVEEPAVETMYVPSNTDNIWETKSISSLGWNQSEIQPLKDFLIAFENFN